MEKASNDMKVGIRVRLNSNEVIFERSFKELPIVIGRSMECQVPLPQFNWISRKHIIISNLGGKIVAQDLQTSNGTKIKGRRIDSAELESLSELTIGDLIIEVQLLSPREKTVVDENTDLDGGADKGVIVEFPIESEAERSNFEYTRFNSPRPYPRRPNIPTPAQEMAKKSSEQFTDGTSPPVLPPIPSGSLTPVKPSLPVKQTSSSEVTKTENTLTPKQPLVDLSPRHHRRPQVLAGEEGIGAQLMSLNGHIDRMPTTQRVLEVTVMWKGDVYDTALFRQGQPINIGRSRDGLYLPTMRGDFQIADYTGAHVVCQLPKNCTGQLLQGGDKKISLQELITSQVLKTKRGFYSLKLNATDICQIDMGSDIVVHMRYAQAPRQLSKKDMVTPDDLMKKTTSTSGILHALFVIFCLLMAPEAPRIKGVPKRVARLMVPKKKPEPPKPKKKKPKKKEPEKIVQAKPKEKPKKIEKTEIKKPKRIVKTRRPKRVIVKRDKKIKTLNKKPYKNTKVSSTRRTKEKPPQKDIQQLGALAALGAISKSSQPTVSDKPVAINVNPNAGGSSSPIKANSVIGALKAKGGKLQAGGMAGVKTQGKGYGTGSGYGVQGIKGRAGVRGVAGSVVGSPKLMEIKRTEGLTQKQVMAVVKKNASKIQQCYERALLASPSLAGRVEYEWFIKANGSVQWAKVKRSDMGGADVLNNCVVGVFKGMRFPVAKNGESTRPNIAFPFGRI